MSAAVRKRPDLAFGNVSDSYKAWMPSRLQPVRQLRLLRAKEEDRSIGNDEDDTNQDDGTKEVALRSTKTSSSKESASSHYHMSLLDKPGHYIVRPPPWASVCVVSAAAGGQGGWGADALCDGPNIFIKSGAGGQAGQSITSHIIPMIALESENTRRPLHIQVGAGGAGGCRTYPPASGGKTSISYYSSSPVTTPSSSSLNDSDSIEPIILLLGGGTHASPLLNGAEPQIFVGSQGTPCGGKGGNSLLASGGAGGKPSGDDNLMIQMQPIPLTNSPPPGDCANGSDGSVGGGGGGGAAPYGACSSCGGRGGDGVVILQFLKSFHHQGGKTNP